MPALPYLLAVRGRRSDLLEGFWNEQELCWHSDRRDEAEAKGQMDWGILQEVARPSCQPWRSYLQIEGKLGFESHMHHKDHVDRCGQTPYSQCEHTLFSIQAVPLGGGGIRTRPEPSKHHHGHVPTNFVRLVEMVYLCRFAYTQAANPGLTFIAPLCPPSALVSTFGCPQNNHL